MFYFGDVLGSVFDFGDVFVSAFSLVMCMDYTEMECNLCSTNR